MKNIIKMSLVAAVAVTGLTTIGSANTLEEAFAASTVKGELKSQYFERETTDGVNSSIFSNGGNISFKTGSYNGLTAGVTFQTAHVASSSNETPFANNQNASGSVMSESYLSYNRANTTAKIGRQYISTPLVAGSGSRIFKEAFEGVVVANTDIADTTLVAAYVSKMQGRTDGADAPRFNNEFVVGNVGQTVEIDGAYTVYAKTTSIPNLTLQAQYAVVDVTAQADDATVAYADAAYKVAGITVSGQSYMSDNGNGTTATDGSLVGVKVAGNIAGVSAMAAYTTTDDEANVVTGLGNGADKAFTGAAIYGGTGSAKADVDAYKLGLGYKLNSGLGLNVAYVNWDTAGVETSETDLIASYAFNKAFSAKAIYASYNGNAQDYRSRVYLSYKF